MAAIISRRFGESSQAIVFVLYDELIYVRTLLASDPHRSPFLQSRIAVLRRQIQHLNDISGYLNAGPAPHARLISQQPTLIEYDRAVFDSRYQSVVEDVRPELVQIKDKSLGPLQPGKCYMYVIDQSRQLIVWNSEFKFADLVFGRNRATVNGIPVAHPLLIADTLRVCAAGEFIPFAGGKAGTTLCAAIINTKSGHYRPPPSCAPLIRSVLGQIGLSWSDVDVFTLDPHDGAASQPGLVAE